MSVASGKCSITEAARDVRRDCYIEGVRLIAVSGNGLEASASPNADLNGELWSQAPEDPR